MSKMKNKYLEEYEKYKDIELSLGKYELRTNSYIKYEILQINEAQDRVTLRNIRSLNEMGKTLHWCRKNLVEKN